MSISLTKKFNTEVIFVNSDYIIKHNINCNIYQIALEKKAHIEMNA